MIAASQRRTDLTVAILFAAASLALGWWMSHGHPFWSDELFAWMLITDPSLGHMVTAWRAGADGGGIGFYLLARTWIHLFGRSELAFRLFSASGVAASAILTYLSARRYFPRPIALLGVSLIWFSSPVILWQLKQARFYGLLLASVALAVYLALLALDRPSPTLLVLNFVANTALVATHPFGALYTGCILVGLVGASTAWSRSFSSRSFSPRLYLSVAAGWWPLLVSVTAMRNTAAVGKPSFWTQRPHLSDLRAAYTCFSPLVGRAVLLAVVALAVALLLRRPSLDSLRQKLATPALLLTAPLLASPCLVFLISRHGTSVFVDRYLCPVAVAYCLFLCQLLTLLQSAISAPRHVARIAFATLTLLVGATLFASIRKFYALPYPPVLNPDSAILPHLPRDLPVLFERCDTFDQLLAYHRQEGYRFFYLLDWENILAPESPHGEAAGYHEMENWRKLGYFSGSILPVDQFFPVRGPFVVVDEEPTRWFDRKLHNNPDYTVHLLATVHRSADPASDARIWLVRPRGAIGPLPIPTTPRQVGY